MSECKHPTSRQRASVVPAIANAPDYGNVATVVCLDCQTIIARGQLRGAKRKLPKGYFEPESDRYAFGPHCGEPKDLDDGPDCPAHGAVTE